MDGSEAKGDLVLIQTFFALLWKLFLKNTSQHKNNLIYIIKQEGLYQNKVTLSLASSITVKWSSGQFVWSGQTVVLPERDEYLREILFLTLKQSCFGNSFGPPTTTEFCQSSNESHCKQGRSQVKVGDVVLNSFKSDAAGDANVQCAL